MISLKQEARKLSSAFLEILIKCVLRKVVSNNSNFSFNLLGPQCNAKRMLKKKFGVDHEWELRRQAVSSQLLYTQLKQL